MAIVNGFFPHMNTVRLQPWPNQTTTVEVNQDPYRVYRVTVLNNYGDQRKGFGEFEGYDAGGAYVFAGGSSSASAVFGDWAADRAFARSFLSASRWVSNTTGTQWVQYDLGVGNSAAVAFGKFGVYPQFAGTYEAQQWRVDASDDGVEFVTLLEVSTPTPWAQEALGVWCAPLEPDFGYVSFCAGRYGEAYLPPRDGRSGIVRSINPKFYRWVVYDNHGYTFSVIDFVELLDTSGNVISLSHAGARGWSSGAHHYVPSHVLKGPSGTLREWWVYGGTPTAAAPHLLGVRVSDGHETPVAGYRIGMPDREQEHGAAWKHWVFQFSFDGFTWHTAHEKQDEPQWGLGSVNEYLFENDNP